MNFQIIEKVVLEILQEAEGKFQFPYQIFEKIKMKDAALAQSIENEYPVINGNPKMGAGAGRPYSSASFIALALNKFMARYDEIRKEWFEPSDITIKEIQPGNPDMISIWAWKQ